MERNLYDLDPELYRRDYRLAKAVVTAVLQALVVFETNGRIHSGRMSLPDLPLALANMSKYKTGQYLDRLSWRSRIRSQAIGFSRGYVFEAWQTPH